jgi:Taurine catabolism dioxygenase TauD, TfdA family
MIELCHVEPAAWTAASFRSSADFACDLGNSDRAEIAAAVARLKREGRLSRIEALGAADFVFGAELRARLRNAFDEVRDGRGFVLIRGLPHAGLALEDFAAVAWGIGTAFGDALSQNAQGELIGHVIDATASEPTPRMYRSALELGPHNDPTAMLALACWNLPQSGGESVLVSTISIYNEIARRAPELLEPLTRGFYYHRLGEEGPDQEPVTPYRVPVFAVRGGHVSCRNIRAGFIAAHHELGVPITDRELAAIDLFDEIARRPENAVCCSLEPGTMVVINNYVVLHARRAFIDGPDLAHRRHLLRFWFDAPGFRDVPAEFQLMPGANGIPPQAGRRCTYDFQKLFREARPELLGRARREPPTTARSDS